MFSNKDRVSDDLRSRVIYKFKCANCSVSYIGETHRHYMTRVREHLTSDQNSLVHQHLSQNVSCAMSASPTCFQIIDQASDDYALRIKESLYITWSNETLLNKQVKHPIAGLVC